MQSLSLLGLYVGAGAVAGLASGLLGIGGGLVMVPVLLSGFALAGIAPEAIPALALGTSLSAVAVTCLVASRAHWRHGTLRLPPAAATVRMTAALVAGVVAGSALAAHLPRQAVLAGIALFQVTVAVLMLRRSAGAATVATGEGGADATARLAGSGAARFMALTGIVSASGGVGGATLMVPYFTHRGLAITHAAALSTFFGCVIGAIGAASYALLGHPPVPVPLAIGYVSLPAFACLALGSALLVPVGARLSRRLSKEVLTRAFCALLLVSGARVLMPLAAAAFTTAG